MPKITYIDSSGNQKTIEVEIGLTVMEGAIQNNVTGIDADCGGGMSCATCHVYVKEEWSNYSNRKFRRLDCYNTGKTKLDAKDNFYRLQRKQKNY